jgi:hypothetical protein
MTYYNLGAGYSLSEANAKRGQQKLKNQAAAAARDAELYKDQAERKAGELKNIYIGAAIAVPLLWLFLRK